MNTRTRRWLRGLALGVGGFVALVGLLHLPAARPLLAFVGVGCPAQASPHDVEAARRAAARAERGQTPSPARPALGFSLDETGVGDVQRWAEDHRLDCRTQRAGTLVVCKDVPARLLGGPDGSVDDVSFAFEPEGHRLVTVTTLRNRLDPEGASAQMQGIMRELERRLGAGQSYGEAEPAFLAAHPMRTAKVEYRYADYIANVSATNLGARVVLREHYMSATH